MNNKKNIEKLAKFIEAKKAEVLQFMEENEICVSMSFDVTRYEHTGANVSKTRVQMLGHTPEDLATIEALGGKFAPHSEEFDQMVASLEGAEVFTLVEREVK